jgi:DNA-binding MarR family transcriptional regulator
MKNEISDVEMLALEFLDAAATLERRLDRALAMTRGISFSEYRLLRSIGNARSGGTRRVDLANSVGLTPSAVTRALKPMEKLGYVTTTRSERDARQSLAELTPAGESLLKDAQAVLSDIFRSLPLQSLSDQKISELKLRLDELRGGAQRHAL